MSLGISESKVYAALSQVEHPEFKEHNLVALGMIPQVDVKTENIQVLRLWTYVATSAR